MAFYAGLVDFICQHERFSLHRCVHVLILKQEDRADTLN